MLEPAAIQFLMLGGLLIYSILDIEYRSVPAAEIFFVGGCLLEVNNGNWVNLLSVILAVAFGSLPRLPNWLGWPLLFFPPAWPAFLVGSGVRRELLGRGDLFIIGIISLVYPLDIAIGAVIGMVLWARWWAGTRAEQRIVPLVPGILVGSVAGVGIHSILRSWFRI
jgi:hypothetical protein